MLNAFINTIPSGVNVLFAIGTLIFFLQCLQGQRCHRSPFFIYSFLFIVLVIVSRTIIGISSSRYAVILLYPTIIATVYLCLRLKKIIRVFSAKQRVPYPHIQRALILIISLLCIGATLKLNPYRNHFYEAYKIIKEKKAQAEQDGKQLEIWHCGNDSRRLEYYTGITPIYMSGNWHETIGDKILSFNKANTIVIFDLTTSPTHKQLFDKFSETASPSPIEPLFCSWTSKSKQKMHALYSYENASVLAQVVKEDTPLCGNDNELKDGTLSQLIFGETARRKLPLHMQTFAAATQAEFKMPETGYFLVNKTTQDDNLFFGTTDSSMGDGNAIFMEAKFIWFLFRQHIKKGKYLFSVLVRGEKQTEIRLITNYKFNDKWQVTPLVRFFIPDEKIYKVSAYFDYTTSEIDFFRVGVELNNGKATFDNFVLQRMD